MAVCVAVIGKENSPLYVWVGSGREELHLHYLAHTALDVIQEKVAAVNKTPGDTRELYLGLLYASEEYKVFGYTTNTRIKFVIITDAANTTLRDNEIRMMFSVCTTCIQMLCAILSISLESRWHQRI